MQLNQLSIDITHPQQTIIQVFIYTILLYNQMGKGRILDALQLSGSQHRYQKCLVVLLSLLWIQVNFILIGPSFIYMNPNFTCSGVQQAKVFQVDACGMLGECKLIDYFNITSDMNLYCDKMQTRKFTQVVFAIGAFAGLIVINLISDIKGRRISSIIALAFSNVGPICAFLGGTYNSIALLAVSQFCGGFGAYSFIPLSYTILSDFCSDNQRQRGVVLINSSWGISTAGLGIMYIFKTHWSTYLLYYLIIPLFIISVIFIYYLVESPYVLVHRQRPEQAIQVLRQICRFNRRQQNIPHIQHIFYQQDYQDQEMATKPTVMGILSIIKRGQYLRPILILMIIQTIATLNLYGVSYALQIEGLGYGVNSIIAGTIQMTSFIYLNLLINKIPRRLGIAGFYVIVALLGLSFLIPAIKKNNLLTSVAIGISRIASTGAYTLLACMQTQSFTVQIQSTAAALIQTFSVLGIIFGPLLVGMSQHVHIDPIVLISLTLNFAIWPSLCLRQTLKTKSESQLSSIKQSQRLIRNVHQIKKTQITQ